MKKGNWGSRLFAGLLTVIMTVILIPPSVYPEGSVVYAASEVENRLNALRSKYPEESRHNERFDGGSECVGFANHVFYDVFGIYRSQMKKRNDRENIQVGDYVRFGSDKNGHSLIVIARSGNIITAVEGNYASGYVHWGGKYDLYGTLGNGYGFAYYCHASNYDEINVKKGSYMATGGSQTIQDGDYHIVSDLDSQFGLDANEAGHQNGTNIQIALNANQDEQVFHVKYLGNGFYNIIHKASGKVLDVSNSSPESALLEKRNVQLWERVGEKGTAAQQWVIHENLDGTFSLQARCSGFYLDVQGGIAADRQNVWVYEKNDTAAQKWHFTPYGKSIGRTIDDGEYQIVLKRDPSLVMGPEGSQTVSGTNVQLDAHKGDRRYTFDIKYLGDGFYSIIHHESGLSLDVFNGNIARRTNLQLFSKNNTVSQKWIIKPNGSGYNIISQNNALYVDLDGETAVSNPHTLAGRNIWMWIGNGTSNQSWLFVTWVSTPEISALPSASSITYGQSLSSSSLGGGTVNTGGRFVWKNSTIRPSCADSGKTQYQVQFIPSDGKGWKTVEVSVTLKVNPAKNPPNVPTGAMYPDHTKNTVKEVALPTGWSWQSADQNIKLQDQKPVKAVAVYTGKDKGNYVNEQVEISLIRSECKHPKDRQELRNAVAAESGKEGYTGDVFCLECQTVIQKGTVIAALDLDGGTRESDQNKPGNADEEGSDEDSSEDSGTELEEPEQPDDLDDPADTSLEEGEIYTADGISYRAAASGEARGTVEITSAENKSVKNAKIPDTVMINGYSFKVTGVADHAFSRCKNLKTVTLGKNITSVGDRAFYKCTSLTMVTAPASVTEIGDSAFYGCKNLKIVKGFDGVISIGSRAFYNCEKLVTVGSKSKSVTLKKVQTIGNNAFYGCKAIKKVNLTSTVLTKIGASAFEGCTSLTSFTSKSKKLVSIGRKAFYGDEKLGIVSLRTEKLKKSKVGSNVFKGIKSSCSFKVPKGRINSYKSIFKAKGAGKKFKVTKL